MLYSLEVPTPNPTNGTFTSKNIAILGVQDKAHFVEKSGAAINLGMGDKYDTKKLLTGLNSGKTELTSMSLKGKKIIDGRGLFRITEAINELVKE